VEVTCLQCGIAFDKSPSHIKKSKNHFCTRSCAATFNNHRYPKRKKEGLCAECGTVIHTNRKYCADCGEVRKAVAKKRKDKRIQSGEAKRDYNEYMKNYMNRLYQRRRELALETLGGRCIWCGSIEDLQIDHVNREDKSFSVGDLYGVSEERYLAELEKCQLLCRTCHSEKSIIERGHIPAKGHHGRPSSYKYCKCDLCRQASNAYQKRWRAKRKAEKEQLESSS
jgi:hypothetical protein